VLAFDIAADGSLTGRRTILEDLPVVSALHAANGLELGPYGWLYLPVGNVDRLWWDPARVEGHTPHVDWLGTVLRLDGSGSAPEVVARGFRNVYEVAFEPDGRLWAVNNDGNAQAGFLLEELVQVKPGLDYGFPREGTFGPRTARQEGPAWVMPTNGTAGLAWLGSVGLGSIIGTLRHLVAADTSYLALLSDGGVAVLDEEDDLDLAALRDAMVANGPVWAEVVARDLDPGTVIIRRRDDGSESHAPLGIRLAQAIHHGTDHRSQVCTALTTLSIEPPAIDAWDYADGQGRLVEIAPSA